MSNLKGKVVAITGASSGIGEATARLLAERGARVVLGARRVERLERIVRELAERGAEAHFRALDVSDRQSVRAFVNFAAETLGRLDAVVNNAGLMPLAPMSALEVEQWEQMVDVNIKGVLYGIAAGLPIFKAQGSGHFINVSSIAAHGVVPNAAVYCATKSAVNAISEGLRQENGDLRVTVISPGVTTSELAHTTSDPATRQWLEEYRTTAIGPDAIARAIAFALEQPGDVDVNEIIVRPTAAR
jgi:NADP-dependent 3-hydroxy acid dehydrogenase YdfG